MGKKNRKSKAVAGESTTTTSISINLNGNQAKTNLNLGKKIKKRNEFKDRKALKQHQLFQNSIEGPSFSVLEGHEDIEFNDPTSVLEKQFIEEEKIKAKEKLILEKKQKVKENLKLPIKDAKGKLILAKDLTKDDDDDNSEEEIDNLEETESEDEKEEQNELSLEEEEDQINEHNIHSKEYINQKMEEMANAAQKLMEDPETNYGTLKGLRILSTDKNLIVRKYALLTQLSVFKDILPSYRIRPLTEAEKQTKVSKEVKKQRVYEETLISNYQSYVKVLINQFKSATQNPSKYTGFKQVVIKCLTELMVHKAGFNFEDEIIAFITRKMCTTVEDDMLTMCIDATTTLFKEDEYGQSSLNLVQSLTKGIKYKNYKVSPKVIRVFLQLKLKEELIKSSDTQTHTQSKRESEENRKRKVVIDTKLLDERREHLSKRRKKRLKAQREIEREMMEAEAEVSLEHRKRAHSELLKAIFIVYFRILKEAPSSALFPAVLEGLARFGHLISVDFFTDLLTVLKKILNEGLVANSSKLMSSKSITNGSTEPIHTETEVVRCQLLCVLTAFKLLSGQGEALNLDLKDFYTHLYTLLLKVAQLPSSEQEISSENSVPERSASPETRSIQGLVIDCLDALFFKRRGVTLVRSAAFLKRLTTLSLHYPQPSASKLLGLSRAFLMKYSGLDRMLASEDTLGEGTFVETAEDPDNSNPFATSLFELSMLSKCHYDPKIREAALNVIKVSQIKP